MPRFHATPTGPVPFTPAEEIARDAEESQDAADRQARSDAELAEQNALAPIRAALLADIDPTPAQLRRLLRYMLKKTGG